MRRAAPALAMLAVVAATVASPRAQPSSDPQVLTFAITVLPPPPVLAAPPPMPAATAGAAPTGSWVVSETRSPVDYRPVAIATQVAGADDGPRLSIQCRAGQAEMLVLMAAPPTGRETVRFAIDDGPTRPLRAAPSPTQKGVVLGEPVQRFLFGLPDSGSLRLRLAIPGQVELESPLSLQDLAALRQRLAVPCGWPAP